MSTADDNRFYREAPKPTTVEFTDAEIERFTSGIADVLQWLYGFRAALPEETSKKLPGDWEALIELNLKLRRGKTSAPLPF